MKVSTKIILTTIVCIAIFFRFFRLGMIPVGFHRDEAFLGYNAYSLLKTGKDMSGRILPLHFESFIYSPGGYSYLAIPPIAFFGLREFSVRFPSAFFGVATVFLTYFLFGQLFPRHPQRTGLFASLLLAITPWHVNLSRTSAESVVVVFFVALGVSLFLHWQKNHSFLSLFFSFLSFGITLTLYQAPRALLPLFIPLLIISTKKTNPKKHVVLPFILLVICIAVPVVGILATPTLATRMKTVGIWSTQETQLLVNEQIREDGAKHVPPLLSRVVHNKLIGYTQAFLNNYFEHFSYAFLFTDAGMPDRYRVPGIGLLFHAMFPLLLVGIFVAVSRYPKKIILLGSWILLSIVGSALTFDDIPNTQRTVLVFPALSILMAMGMERILQIKRILLRALILGALGFLFTFEGYRYVHHYTIQQLIHRPWYRQEGYKEMVSTVLSRKNEYKEIVVTNRESAPTIFFLFYTAYDPVTFQEETKYSTFRDFDRINFSNYIFSLEECPLKEVAYKDPVTQKDITDCYAQEATLYVNSGLCQKPNVCANIIGQINRNDQTPVFLILERSAAAATLSGKPR